MINLPKLGNLRELNLHSFQTKRQKGKIVNQKLEVRFRLRFAVTALRDQGVLNSFRFSLKSVAFQN